MEPHTAEPVSEPPLRKDAVARGAVRAAPSEAALAHEAEAERPRPRGLTLVAILAVLLAPFALPTFGIAVALAVILLVASWLLYRRGYAVRRLVIAAALSLVLSLVSFGACFQLVFVPVEVEGTERTRQTDVEGEFERAFEEATAPPPAREGAKE